IAAGRGRALHVERPVRQSAAPAARRARRARRAAESVKTRSGAPAGGNREWLGPRSRAIGEMGNYCGFFSGLIGTYRDGRALSRSPSFAVALRHYGKSGQNAVQAGLYK